MSFRCVCMSSKSASSWGTMCMSTTISPKLSRPQKYRCGFYKPTRHVEIPHSLSYACHAHTQQLDAHERCILLCCPAFGVFYQCTSRPLYPSLLIELHGNCNAVPLQLALLCSATCPALLCNLPCTDPKLILPCSATCHDSCVAWCTSCECSCMMPHPL